MLLMDFVKSKLLLYGQHSESWAKTAGISLVQHKQVKNRGQICSLRSGDIQSIQRKQVNYTHRPSCEAIY